MHEILPLQPTENSGTNLGIYAEKFNDTNILAQHFTRAELDEFLISNSHYINQQHSDFKNVHLDTFQHILDLRSKGPENVYDEFLYNYSGSTKPDNAEPLPELKGLWGAETEADDENKVEFTDRLCDGYTTRGDLVHIRTYTHPSGQTFFFPVIADLFGGSDHEGSLDTSWEDSADVITVKGDNDAIYLWHGNEAPVISLSRATGKAKLLKDGEWLDILPMNELTEGVAQRELGILVTESEAEFPIAA